MWANIKSFFKNRLVKFSFWSVIYVLWFVVWSRNMWMLLGVPIIFDIYVTKFLFGKLSASHKRHRERNKLYREVTSWVEALVFAVVVASIVHIYVFQIYKIPTPSMEKTLLVGDYLLVSKVTYGPKMPNTPISMPLVHNSIGGRKSYSECIRLPYKRLSGFRSIRRDDIIVFNFPAGDTVLLENQSITYYDALRKLIPNYGEQEARAMIRHQYTVISRPVDKREHYVKRCVAIAGDTIQVIDGQVFVNNNKQVDVAGKQYLYIVRTNNGTPINRDALSRIGLQAGEDYYYDSNTAEYRMLLTDANRQTINKMVNVTSIEKLSIQAGSEVFPHSEKYMWSVDNFGPLWVPKHGTTIDLNIDNLPIYERIITAYEGNELKTIGADIYINGILSTSYTFSLNYYFMMGDNRDDSLDSRFWGFVPEDHIVGTPTLVLLSSGKDGIRWSRLLKSTK